MFLESHNYPMVCSWGIAAQYILMLFRLLFYSGKFLHDFFQNVISDS